MAEAEKNMLDVMESIEAKVADEDVEMKDQPEQPGADSNADADPEADADGEVDADGEPDEEAEPYQSRDPTDLLNAMGKLESFLRNYLEECVMQNLCFLVLSYG
jgi:hypothetical protein